MHTANLHFYDRSRKKFYIDFKLCWWTTDLKLLSVAWVKQIYLKIICKTPMRNKCFNYLHFFLQSPSPSRVDRTCPLEEEIKLLNLFIQKNLSISVLTDLVFSFLLVSQKEQTLVGNLRLLHGGKSERKDSWHPGENKSSLSG